MRLVAYVEGTTYLVLLAGAVWRRAFDGPDLTALLGLTHGLVFLVLVAAVLVARRPLGWDGRQTAVALGVAIFPGGGYLVGRDVDRELRRGRPGAGPRGGPRAGRGATGG